MKTPTGQGVPLPFRGGGSCPVQYEVDHGGHNYYVRYRFGRVTVTQDIDSADIELFEQQLSRDDLDGFWSSEATNVYLTLIGQAIETGSLGRLRLPWKHDIRRHALYRRGAFEGYDPKAGDGPAER